MKDKRAYRIFGSQAFSMVELLVVIAVIGIIAAIAVPNIANIAGAAKYAKDQRNAQAVAGAVAEAGAAGYTNFPSSTDNYYTLSCVVANGGYGVVGPNGTNVFKVSGLSPYDTYALSFFLQSDTIYGLKYHSTPARTDYESLWPTLSNNFMTYWTVAATKTDPTLQ